MFPAIIIQNFLYVNSRYTSDPIASPPFFQNGDFLSQQAFSDSDIIE